MDDQRARSTQGIATESTSTQSEEAPIQQGESTGQHEEPQHPNNTSIARASGSSPTRRESPSPRSEAFHQWTQTVLAAMTAITTVGALAYTAVTTRTAVETVDLTAKGQITDRFTAAVGQLGEDQVAVRLGGIYALERIAQESPNNQGVIMNVLTGFLRENSKAPEVPNREAAAPETPLASTLIPQPAHAVSADIEAAALVLGRRNTSNDPSGFTLDLTGVDLRGARLDGVNFSNAWIMSADFSGTRLRGANFSHAKLKPGEVDPATDWTSKGSVNFTGAVLEGANFSDSLLVGSIFAGAWMPRSNFQKSIFATSDFRNSVVAGSDFSNSEFTSSRLNGSRMNSSTLSGAQFTAATVKDAELDGIDFRAALYGPIEYQIGTFNEKKECTGTWIPKPAGCP
ncbi:pentapeptide repeat-containing protein [Kitasatospora griseola]